MLKMSPSPHPVALILIAISVATTTGCTRSNSGDNVPLPSSPSEDVSHLLVKPESAAGEFDFDAPRDYLPDPNIDWVVTFEFEGSAPVRRDRINALLDTERAKIEEVVQKLRDAGFVPGESQTLRVF